ncbi:alginate lyase family protein [Novosphingobium sp.]|uniref:alginate lyase family protein n=1 Tax=Novosphingobium sp. TaxID=1874826 RepID=UPI0025D179E2|nr:alginate lyase family protein [Novosphingobium sp.]
MICRVVPDRLTGVCRPLRAICAALLVLQLPVQAAAAPAGTRAVCRGSDGYAEAFEGRRTFLWRPEWLRAQKAAIAADAARAAALRKAADAALASPAFSVRDKSTVPPSGDKGDYLSIGPYWWPDPDKPGGLPYRRDDGRVNPERSGNAFDHSRLGAFSSSVRTLALASYFLDDARYARGATDRLHAWFVAPATRMNPNLNFGQSVPGLSAGRGEGLIEMTALIPVVESIGLIEPSGTMSASDREALGAWFADFVKWMAQSPIGTEERQKQNNHGIYYDLLLGEFALFAGMEPVTRQVASAFPARRLALQMNADGQFPDELKRTRSWHYAHFVATGALQLATIAECSQIDLWNAATPDGRSLRTAMQFLLPFQGRIERWPFSDIETRNPGKQQGLSRTAIETLRLAAWGFADPTFEKTANAYKLKPKGDDELWLAPFGLPKEKPSNGY